MVINGREVVAVGYELQVGGQQYRVLLPEGEEPESMVGEYAPLAVWRDHGYRHLGYMLIRRSLHTSIRRWQDLHWDCVGDGRQVTAD